jgi:hypothetical protein
MAVTYTGSITKTIGYNASGSLDTNGVVLPQSSLTAPANGAITSFTNGSGASQITKVWRDSRTLSATSVTLDLTALTATADGMAGAFTAIKGLYIRNDATTAGFTLTLYNAASTSFQARYSAAATVTLNPGESECIENLLAAGWACGTNKSLKIDAGSNNVPFTIVLEGN